MRTLAVLELVENVAPVQLALRLLITPRSALLEFDEVRAIAVPLDAKLLIHPWKHADPQVDRLGHEVFDLVRHRAGRPRREVFVDIAKLAGLDNFDLMPRAAIPYLDEPWYC